MAPAQATDLIGVGRVLRRGQPVGKHGRMTNCDAEILDPQAASRPRPSGLTSSVERPLERDFFELAGSDVEDEPT